MIKRVFEITKRFLCDPLIRIGYLSNIGVTNIISDEKYLKIKYKLAMGKELDLNHPKTYNEKLQWLKLYDRQDAYIKMVDKYAVKEYVASVIGNQYIIPTLGVWENFDSIEFDKLPKKFVLKCTHDSGGIVICKNKDELDIKAAKKIINKCLRRNYFWSGREWPYKKVPHRIIAEEYVEDSETKDLRDYKFFVFDGEVKALFVALDRNSNEETKFNFFDKDFHPLNLMNGHPNTEQIINKPQNFEIMKQLAEKLGKDIPHVRVDFYEVDGKVLFGELTFFHWSGFVLFEPEEWDYKFGEWIDLSKVKSN